MTSCEGQTFKVDSIFINCYMEKFSVLMSVYYKENPSFFDQALESILVNQTLLPNEFVLVCDGGLNPELEAVIDKYKDLLPDIFRVFRKMGGGLGKALNFGLPKCSYPLVARADSDDICVPNRFEKQVAFFEQHPEVGIISSYIDEFDTDWTKPNNLKKLPLTHEELFRMATFRNPLNHMAVMMRKDDIIGIGSYNHVPYAEDYELWVRALTHGIKIANVGEVLVHARVGNGMVQRRGTKKLIRSWHSINKEMIDGNMIGYGKYLRNMISITAFVFMPDRLKIFLYEKVLRK